MAYVAPILAFKELSSDYIVHMNIIWISIGCEISYGISLAKVGRLGAENNCYHIIILYYYLGVL